MALLTPRKAQSKNLWASKGRLQRCARFSGAAGGHVPTIPKRKEESEEWTSQERSWLNSLKHGFSGLVSKLNGPILKSQALCGIENGLPQNLNQKVRLSSSPSCLRAQDPTRLPRIHAWLQLKGTPETM